MREFEKYIRKVEPYVPGEQPQRKVIKLNTNENPYPPAPGVQRAMREMDAESLRLYPDPSSDCLVEELAAFYGVEKNQVFVGVGSDDVLAMCFLTFFNAKKPILFPDITYSFYQVWAGLYRIPYECKPLNEEFRMVKEDYYGENGGIIFPNPNAPTAIYEDLGFVEDILTHNRDVIVIVDEAYIDFAGRSALELIDKYDNLIVVQTFSKARSMAGLRIGYAIGSPLLIRYLNDAKYSFNSYTMNRPSLVYGTEALKDRPYFEETLKKIIRTREEADRRFRSMGFTCLPSSANFLFVSHPDYEAGELFQALKEEGIYVRYWGTGRIRQFLRVSVGTDEEMDTLFDFIETYMENRKQ